MFHVFSTLMTRLRTQPSVMPSTSHEPPPASAVPRINDFYIRVRDLAVPQLRDAAGITSGDLAELIANGRYTTLRERAIGSNGPWAQSTEGISALAGVCRDLHLLVFDPEREAFIVVFAKADPEGERLTITRVTTAQHYETTRWHLLPIETYRQACATSVSDPLVRDRLLASLPGRDLDTLPVLFSLQNDKRMVWAELVMRDGRQRRLGLLPFDLRKLRATDLPSLDGFWDWAQSTPTAAESPIALEAVAAIRLIGQRDPYDVTVAMATVHPPAAS